MDEETEAGCLDTEQPNSKKDKLLWAISDPAVQHGAPFETQKGDEWIRVQR